MRICAWFFRKRFFTKNAFSPEGEFLPKNYVVLFYVNSINNSMRVCAYAHGYPPIPFFFFSILFMRSTAVPHGGIRGFPRGRFF